MIGKVLNSIGISPKLSGYVYLLDAIALIIDNRSMMRNLSSCLYTEVARRMGTSAFCVERGIRTAIASVYRGDRKPSNLEFLSRMCDMVSDLLRP